MTCLRFQQEQNKSSRYSFLCLSVYDYFSSAECLFLKGLVEPIEPQWRLHPCGFLHFCFVGVEAGSDYDEVEIASWDGRDNKLGD